MGDAPALIGKTGTETYCSHYKKYSSLLYPLFIQTTKEKLVKHTNDSTQYHLSLALNKITEQQNLIQKMAAKLEASPCSSLFKDEHVIKIDDFQRRLQKAENGVSSLTKHFFTSRLQKIEIVLYWKGNAKDSVGYISFFLCCKHTSYDDLLDWPMKATIHCGILHENTVHFSSKVPTKDAFQDSNTFQKPERDEEQERWGRNRFVSLNDACNLIENDCLSLKIKVDHH